LMYCLPSSSMKLPPDVATPAMPRNLSLIDCNMRPSLVVVQVQQPQSMYVLNTLLLCREDLAAQIEHRQRAGDLYSFTDFEDGEVPV